MAQPELQIRAALLLALFALLGLLRLVMADGGTGGGPCRGMAAAHLVSCNAADSGALGGTSRFLVAVLVRCEDRARRKGRPDEAGEHQSQDQTSHQNLLRMSA